MKCTSECSDEHPTGLLCPPHSVFNAGFLCVSFAGALVGGMIGVTAVRNNSNVFSLGVLKCGGS